MGVNELGEGITLPLLVFTEIAQKTALLLLLCIVMSQ
jgi:hypothetical protein